MPNLNVPFKAYLVVCAVTGAKLGVDALVQITPAVIKSVDYNALAQSGTIFIMSVSINNAYMNDGQMPNAPVPYFQHTSLIARYMANAGSPEAALARGAQALCIYGVSGLALTINGDTSVAGAAMIFGYMQHMRADLGEACLLVISSLLNLETDKDNPKTKIRKRNVFILRILYVIVKVLKNPKYSLGKKVFIILVCFGGKIVSIYIQCLKKSFQILKESLELHSLLVECKTNKKKLKSLISDIYIQKLIKNRKNRIKLKKSPLFSKS